MSTATFFDMNTLRQGIETRDATLLASLYSDDAEMVEVDKDHPPRSPRRFSGRDEIESHLRDVCSRDMTHDFTLPVLEGNRLAFTEACQYGDGTNVLSITIAELDDHNMIARQTAVTAWDG